MRLSYVVLIAALIYDIVFIGYTRLAYPMPDMGGDESHYMSVAKTFVTTGRPVYPLAEGSHYEKYGHGVFTLWLYHAVYGLGQMFSDTLDIGVGRWMSMGFIAAASLFFGISLRSLFGYDWRLCAVVAALMPISTLWLRVYSIARPESMSTCFVVLALWNLCLAHMRKAARGFLLSGVLFGLLFGIQESTSVIMIGAAGLYFLLYCRKRSALWFGLGVMSVLAVYSGAYLLAFRQVHGLAPNVISVVQTKGALFVMMSGKWRHGFSIAVGNLKDHALGYVLCVLPFYLSSCVVQYGWHRAAREVMSVFLSDESSLVEAFWLRWTGLVLFIAALLLPLYCIRYEAFLLIPLLFWLAQIGAVIVRRQSLLIFPFLLVVAVFYTTWFTWLIVIKYQGLLLLTAVLLAIATWEWRRGQRSLPQGMGQG